MKYLRKNGKKRISNEKIFIKQFVWENNMDNNISTLIHIIVKTL